MNRQSKWSIGVGILVVSINIMEVSAATRYVSLSGGNSPPYTNWSQAATTIQTALGVSTDGDTVIVTNGNYLLASSISITNGVMLMSATGPQSTIINGQGARRCIYLSHSNALVRGFTVTGGSTDNGGGVMIESWGSVWNCIIVSNSASGWGGGIYLLQGGSLYNSIVANNSAQKGGGVFCGWRSAGGGFVQNCTIVKNSSTQEGGGLQLHHAGYVYNSIIISNASVDGANWFTFDVSPSFNHCCTVPTPAGSSIITNDPQFLDFPSGDYHLNQNSPCVDKGIQLPWMVGETDIEGNLRILNIVDIGAYERGLALSIICSAVDVSWGSRTGKTYQLQYAMSLDSNTWTNLGGSLLGTGSNVYYMDIIRTNPATRFYRVLETP